MNLQIYHPGQKRIDFTFTKSMSLAPYLRVSRRHTHTFLRPRSLSSLPLYFRETRTGRHEMHRVARVMTLERGQLMRHHAGTPGSTSERKESERQSDCRSVMCLSRDVDLNRGVETVSLDWLIKFR